MRVDDHRHRLAGDRLHALEERLAPPASFVSTSTTPPLVMNTPTCRR